LTRGRYVTDNHFLDTFAFHAISGRERASRFGYPAAITTGAGLGPRGRP